MTATALLVLLFWVFLAFDTKRWWPSSQAFRCPEPERVPSGASVGSEDVLVIVPALNEEETLAETLPALLAQSPSFAGLVLVDDRSTDRTGEIARSLAGSSAEPEKLLVVTSQPPPAGWLGKIHGLKTGLDAAGGSSEWLLLTDADILHPRGSIAALVEKARKEGIELVSVMARLRAETFWEKLLIPPFVWFFQLLYPFRRVSDSRSSTAAAAGGCVLLRRSLLEKIGGFQAIGGAVIDDVRLARLAKKSGARIWLGLGPEILSVRRSEKLEDITRMVARTAFDQLGYRYSLVLGTLVFLGLFFVAPPVLVALGAVVGDGPAMVLSLAAVLIQAALFLPAVRHHRVSPFFALTLPLASVLYAYMTGVSAWRHWRRQGVPWRGRKILSQGTTRPWRAFRKDSC